MRRQHALTHVTLSLLLTWGTLSTTGCKDDPDLTTPKPVTCDSTAPTIWVGGSWNISGNGKRRLCQDKSVNLAFELSTEVSLRVEATANSRGMNATDGGGVLADAAAIDAATDLATDLATDAAIDSATDAATDATTDSATDSATDVSAVADGTLGDTGAREAAVPTDAGCDALALDLGPGRPSAFDLTLHQGPVGFGLTGSVRGNCVEFTTEEQTDEGRVTYLFQGKATAGGNITGTFTGTSPGGCLASGNFTVAISLDADPYPPIKPPPKLDLGVRHDRGPDTTCTPGTCVAGLSCGDVADGCGGTLSCGECTSGTCGGGGTVGVCGCAATAQVGPKSPSAGVNDQRWGIKKWTKPGAITAEDASGSSTTGAATATLYKGQANTNYLLATGFGLTVPSTALITGITVEVRRRSLQGTGDIVDDRISLVANDAVTALNRAKAAPWSGAWTYASYGAASDLWGRVWTPAEVNGTDFGVAFAARYVGGAGNDRPWVDHVRVTVHYAESCP
ncbi:MAG: hypothetical protein KAI47_24720 [Deltaproteobacteria bacterium]|nr:hypothetical protein [Deltaproteobacteria bacterium]